MTASAPHVSVVMRSKNSEGVIGQTIAGLFSQEFKDFELVVVDSGSTDATLDIVRHYPNRTIEIAPQDYHPGPVLNDAIASCGGEIIVFLNSDAVPLSPQALGRLVAAFDDPSVDAALARQVPRPDAHAWVRRDYAVSFPEVGPTPPWITFSLPMAAMRKSAWSRHGFYSDAWGSEDTEWGHWAACNDAKIVYVQDALVMHSHNYTLRQLYGRRFIEGEADAFIYGRSEGLTRAALRTLASVVHDLAACIRDRDLADIARIPVRRAVFHWGHLKGHRHGTRRRHEGDADTTVGQEAVLMRHESSR